jgi:hypothetical protein
MQAAPLRALIALVLMLLTMVSSGCRAQPGAGSPPAARVGEAPTQQRASRLQEVPPPGAVTALNERLAEHQPQVDIVAPHDDALLPEGPWTLQLRVSDWPLSDAADLGIGPHLVVQLDQQPPLRLSSAEAAASVVMPALQPGSHRLTVYAARPWGEAMKSAGAIRQIRLHRVSRNSAELPARGSAQLIVASPADPAQQEPVLLDWLLLDAPLQHLHDDDARWRLRVSVNGDSVLVDRQTPLWLNGFRPGSNAVQLELLDARGDALNPPFNSLVREVVISSGSHPAWRNSSLTASQLALLSGDIPTTEPEPRIEPAAEAEKPAPAASTPQQQPERHPVPTPQNQPQLEPAPAAGALTEPLPAPSEPTRTEGSTTQPEWAAEQRREPDTTPETTNDTSSSNSIAAAKAGIDSDPMPEATGELPSELTDTAPQQPAAPESSAANQAISSAPARSPAGAEVTTEPVEPRPVAPSAREQVNADGSLVQPKPRGPLAGLREKLGG